MQSNQYRHTRHFLEASQTTALLLCRSASWTSQETAFLSVPYCRSRQVCLFSCCAGLPCDVLCPLMLPCCMLSSKLPFTRCAVQEYFVDDLCELMLYVGQAAPRSLEGLQLEEIMIFMVVFMGSPGYVKNPFLRSRISEATPPHTRTHERTHTCTPSLILSGGSCRTC